MFMGYLLAIACLGLTDAASENNSVVSLFIYGADQQSLVGSVIESRSEIATYSINCPSGTNSSDCGVSSGLLYTEGPTTVQWELQTPYDAYVQPLLYQNTQVSTTHNVISNVYGRVICSTGGTTTAVCTEVTPTNGSTAVTSETTALNSDEITLLAVTITARANTSSSNATVTAITTTTSTATNSSDMATSTSASGDTVPISVPTEFFLGGLAVALIAIAL
ncbi:hypothetical protein N7493_006430 [Penicillium malachiteum]|uniref:Uncharacterized protein n=1 Tax=Penicillium malachiteum TaxID=1324776 RepID=A0AAD6HKJ8_9EURO|nr:hypothetical protein N7493_006430 [Penicillium malachiteum]